MNNLITEKTMTTKEIAEVFQCDLRTIQRSVKKLFPDIIENGKTTQLNEIQVTAIKLDIQQHHNLGSTVEVQETDFEMMLLQKKVDMWKDRKLREAKQLIKELTPKALFYDQVTQSNDTVDMKEAAKVLNIGMGRNTMFLKLRELKILDSKNQPYQSFVNNGYFRIIESQYEKNGEIKINLKTVVFQKGLDFIRKILTKRESIK